MHRILPLRFPLLACTCLFTGGLGPVMTTAAEPGTILLPAGSPWRFATEYPPAGWEQPDFEDQEWKEGRGGFGDGGSTAWASGQRWLRGVVELGEVPAAPQFAIRHRGDVEIYLNGHLVADLSGNTPRFVPLP